MYYFICTLGGSQIAAGTLFKTNNPDLSDMEGEGYEFRSLSEADFYLLYTVPDKWFGKFVDRDIVAYYQKNGKIKVGFIEKRGEKYKVLRAKYEKPLKFLDIMRFYKLCLEGHIDFEEIMDNRDFIVVGEYYQDNRKKPQQPEILPPPKKKSFLKRLFSWKLI